LGIANFIRWPGRSGALRPHSPLRTVRDSFPSYSSSISKVSLVETPGNRKIRYLCVTHLQPSNDTLNEILKKENPKQTNHWWAHRQQRPSFAFPSKKVLQIISQWNTNRIACPELAEGWAPTSSRRNFRLSHVSCSILPITGRPLLLPKSYAHHSNSTSRPGGIMPAP